MEWKDMSKEIWNVRKSVGEYWVTVHSTGFVFVGKVTSWVDMESGYLHWT